jgi:hypothetical protein
MLGDDLELLPLLVLALGLALVVGYGLALFRPPPEKVKKQGNNLDRAPAARSLTMIAIGAVASIWALASLLSK